MHHKLLKAPVPTGAQLCIQTHRTPLLQGLLHPVLEPRGKRAPGCVRGEEVEGVLPYRGGLVDRGGVVRAGGVGGGDDGVREGEECGEGRRVEGDQESGGVDY